MAWLNPSHVYVIKTNEKVPLLWQYNGDAAVEFLSGAYFPSYYRIDKTRINRPAYPLMVKLIGSLYALVSYPIYHLSPLLSGMLGYITLKLIIYLSAAILLYNITKRYFPPNISLLAVFLLFLHPFSITFIGTFHTSELQFVNPILIIYLWLNLIDNYSSKKNIFSSLLIGILMLAKQNYAIYLAILAYSFFVLKRRRESLLSFVVHLIPLLAWFITLHYLHIPYHNQEAADGQVVWLLDLFRTLNPVLIAKSLLLAMSGWLLSLTSFFHILLLIALLSWTKVKEVFNTKEKIFFLFFIGMALLQTVAAKRYAPYMSADVAILIVPLAAWGLWSLVEQFNLRKYVPFFLSAYLTLGLATLVTFPWQSPYEQQGITHPDRVKALEEGRL